MIYIYIDFRYFVKSDPKFGYLIKADDDVMVAAEELIRRITQPQMPPAFILGKMSVGATVLRDSKLEPKWSVGRNHFHP